MKTLTSLPWAVQKNLAKDGFKIVSVSTGIEVDNITSDIQDIETADFIVKACNSYNEMLAFIKLVRLEGSRTAKEIVLKYEGRDNWDYDKSYVRRTEYTSFKAKEYKQQILNKGRYSKEESIQLDNQIENDSDILETEFDDLIKLLQEHTEDYYGKSGIPFMLERS